MLFIDTTNTIKEKCNNNIEEATHLENRIGSNNKILDIRNFKFYVEDRKIFDNKGNLKNTEFEVRHRLFQESDGE